MYCPDVVFLKQFYAGRLGHAACVQIWRRLSALWPAASGDSMLGLGYAIPYFASQCTANGVTVAGMPSRQGALYWPQGRENRALLLDEGALPFADNSFNRVLLIHTLEHSDEMGALMREVWRVLVPGGRVLAVVPNRHGLWSHASLSPFGYGRPFSGGQMRHLMDVCGLTPMRQDSALFLPPTRIRWLTRLATTLELVGRMLFPGLGGVLFMEAEKQIYAALKEPVRSRSAVPIVQGVAAAQPAFSPSHSI